MRQAVDADYLVVGAGASGMAFVDALVDHADVSVVVVDRRHAPGGHWLDAYPFVRLHQASVLYGVASTRLGAGRLQSTGPEKGLHERAGAAQICAYYADVMDRLIQTGQVTFLPGCDYLGDGLVKSRVSGQEYEIRSRRVVDARRLEPEIPATTPPPFDVDGRARVVAANDLVHVVDPPDRYVVVGSGKTATDACVWLIGNGVDPGRIQWIRSREPWMLNRAVIQPDPAVFLGMAADLMEVSLQAESLDELFLRLESAGIMLRVDREVVPTMAKAPTLGQWELDLLRSIDNVVRGSHVRAVGSDTITMTDGSVPLERNSLVVHCAASGLRTVPLVPIWEPDTITIQPIRSGFPCFAAALTGYVEATRESDAEKNRLCPPSPYGNSLADWVRMQVLGGRATAAFSAEKDVRDWVNHCRLNPSRIPADQRDRPGVQNAVRRLRESTAPAMRRMADLAGVPSA